MSLSSRDILYFVRGPGLTSLAQISIFSFLYLRRERRKRMQLNGHLSWGLLQPYYSDNAIFAIKTYIFISLPDYMEHDEVVVARILGTGIKKFSGGGCNPLSSPIHPIRPSMLHRAYKHYNATRTSFGVAFNRRSLRESARRTPRNSTNKLKHKIIHTGQATSERNTSPQSNTHCTELELRALEANFRRHFTACTLAYCTQRIEPQNHLTERSKKHSASIWHSDSFAHCIILSPENKIPKWTTQDVEKVCMTTSLLCSRPNSIWILRQTRISFPLIILQWYGSTTIQTVSPILSLLTHPIHIRPVAHALVAYYKWISFCDWNLMVVCCSHVSYYQTACHVNI